MTKALGGILPAHVTVKHTPIPTGSLVIGPKDSDERAYVLAIGVGCEFEIHGWRWGHERKRGRWREDVASPGHFIPQDDLRPLDTLGDD